MTGRFMHFHLPGPNAGRVLTLCEVQMWRKRPYIWRKLTGVSNVALNKPSSQSSFESNQPGEPFHGNDGVTTNSFGSSPYTCTHTANTGIARIPYWMVDLGDTYDINQIELWPRTDCCPERNRYINIYVGFSLDYNYNTIVPGVPLDLGIAAGSRKFTAPLRGRYVIVTRTPQASNTENFLTLCEVLVWANKLLDQPAARSGMSYTSFRGNLVIYGGSGSTGFTIDNNVRMFDMVSGRWAASVTPLGNPPTARYLTHFLPIPDSSAQPVVTPSRDLLIYSGFSNADTLTDANILRFPSCPAFVRDGILAENCTHSGTVCQYTCLSGFTVRNKGPIICRQDGLWDGLVPPCQALTPTAPRGPGFVSELGVSVGTLGTFVNVTYTAPASLGYYGGSGVSSYNVFAAPANDFYEDFSTNDFVNPSAWKRFAEFPTISNNHYFANGKLWLDAAAGSDYWLPTINANSYNVMNRPSAPLGPWFVTGDPLYRGLILHRDWPSNVDPSQPWVYDALLEAGTLPNNAQLCIGLFDPNTCPIPTTSANYPSKCAGHIYFYAGLRKVSEGFYPGFEAVGSGIFGGWLQEQALSPNIYVRIEYSPTGSVNPVGVTYTNAQSQVVTNANQVFKIYIKYRAQDEWVRLPYQIENGALFNGTSLIPPIFRPAIIAKLWNGNIYARAVSSVRYIRIGPTICANPGCSRTVSGNTLTTAVSGLSPGAKYVFGARASTLAGFGASALTNTIYTMPPKAAPVIPALVNAAIRRPTWQSSTYGNDIANNGPQRAVDNDWNTIHHTNCGNEWWAVDLGVNYAAIKQVYIYHRIDCCRERLHHFSFYAGQDQYTPRNNAGQYSRDIDASRLNGGRTDWTQYSMVDMLNGVPTGGQSEGRFNFIAYGRYFYLVNNPYGGNCLHTREMQIFVANSCPARTSVGATVVTGGGKICTAGAPFASVCTMQCRPGYVQVSGATTSTCNGEVWDAPPLVCQPACPDLDAPAYASYGQHEILNFNFNTQFPANLALAVDTLEPITLPFNQFFAITDGVLNAFSRIGCNSDPSAVFYLEKIRAIDGNGKYTFSADISTADRAGLLFRIVDSRNFYRAYYEIQTQSVYVEKLVNGIPIQLTNAKVTVLADVVYNVAVTIDGPNVYVYLNGRLGVQTADRQFAQGYVGLFAGTSATFDNVLFLNTVSSCRGISDGERCLFTCGAGLITKGPNNRTCLTDTSTYTTATWTPTLPVQGAPLNDPGRLLCTLDPPTFPAASLSVPENSITSAAVGSPLMASSTSSLYPVQYVITAQYPNDPFTGSLGTFAIDFCSGQVKVAQPLALNFEFVSSWIITVRAFIFGFDSAETFRNITVSILNVDEPPIITESTIYLPESTAFGSLIGTPSWWDPDNSSVVWALDVDGGQNRFLLNSTTGKVYVNAVSSNSSGFPSLYTGNSAPLSYETAGLPFELVLVAAQTSYTAGTETAYNPPLSTLTTSGKLNIQITDDNDPPMILPGGAIKLYEIDATSVPFDIGVINVVDEDMGAYNSSVSYSLISTLSYPTNCPISPGAILPLSNGMFTVNSSGLYGPLLTLQQIPSVTAPITGATRWRDIQAVPYSGYLVRAVYTLCLQASDAFGGVTIAPVDVAVVANIVNQPVVLNISLSTYATEGNEIVTFGGSGFAPGGGVQPPRAWYSNGIYSYNATNCNVINDNYLSCKTVPGIGKDHVWTIWWDETKPVVFANSIVVNYVSPVVTNVAGNGNLSTVGDSTIVFTGANFGPPNTTVTVLYGSNNLEYVCSYVTNPSDAYTVVRCKTAPGVGQNLPWSITVGGQTFSSSTSSYVISYGNPVVTALSVPSGSTYTISNLDSAGGQDFVIQGSNFGPDGTLLDNRYGIVVTYGSSTGNLLTATNCRQGIGAAAHTTLTCKTVAGVSTDHKVSVFVDGVATTSPYPSSNSTGLSYIKPTITRIYGEGAKQADTAGGQVLYLEGVHFGPINYPVTTIDWVNYGHYPADTNRYAALQCRVTQEPPLTSMITCVTAPGVGRGHALYLSVGGQISAYYLNAVGYAAPQVISFAGAGSAGANTVGGEQVLVNGKNFGPADSYTSSLLRVSYGVELDKPVRGIITNVSYIAAACTVAVAHTQLSCNTAEGAGMNLAWNVILDDVPSAQPTTSYAAPIIDRVQYASNFALVTAANVDGGEVVELVGSFFGPTTYPGSGIPLIQSVTYGISGTEYIVSPSSWTAVSHTLIRVTLLPGTGTNLYFRVMVADQLSTTSGTDGYFSFGIPSIVSLVPSRGPTYSSSLNPFIVTAITRNLPLRDPYTRITLSFGNTNPVLLSPQLPTGDVSIAKNKNADGTVNVTFALPVNGGGLAQAVRFHLGPVTTTVAAYSTVVDSASSFSYNDPVITSIIVTKARFLPEGTNLTESNGAIACPFPNGWDSASSWYCGDSNLQRFELGGTDFTSAISAGQDGVRRQLEILTANYTGIANLGEVWDSTTEVFIHKWDHTSVIAYLRRRSGTFRFTITSPPYWDIATVQSQVIVSTFLDVNPEIGFIGGDPEPFPTVGGTIATKILMTVDNIATADYIEVAVGSSNGTLINPDTNAPFADNLDIKNYILTKGAVQNFNGKWTFGVVVPPGQGSKVAVRVFRVRGTSREFSSALYISYIAPQFSGVAINEGTWGATETITAFTKVIMPTDGTAKIRVYGTNLGPAPVLFIGESTIAKDIVYASIPDKDIMACPGTVGTHTCYEFTTPEGQGDGTFESVYQPLGFKLFLKAIDQTTSGIVVSYRVPSVTSVISNGNGFPTEGNVLVSVIGKNFGFTRGSVDPILRVQFGRVTEANWLNCTDPVRISHYLINCTLPEGAGGDLSVRVQVAELISVTASAGFSYDAPIINSVSIVAGNSSNAGITGTAATAEPGFTHPFMTGVTTGGDVITVTGKNFGKEDMLHCAFLTWAYRSSLSDRLGHTWDCNDVEDWLGEGEIGRYLVDEWTHTKIVFRTPKGLGVKELQLSIRGNVLPIGYYKDTPSTRGANYVFKYAAPQIDHLVVTYPKDKDMSHINTEGGDTIMMHGSGFGLPPTYRQSANLYFSTPADVKVAASYPMAQIAIIFHRACIAYGLTVAEQVVDPSYKITTMPQGNVLVSSCLRTMMVKDDSTIEFLSGPGIGRNRNISVVVIDGPEIIQSNTAFFDYNRPLIGNFNPNPVTLRGEDAKVTIRGSYFGNYELSGPSLQNWDVSEKELNVSIGGFDCKAPGRSRDIDENTNVAETIIYCSVDASLTPAGRRNVTIRVAGQVGTLSTNSTKTLIIGCAAGWYGHEDETCVPCPAQSEDPTKRGAECAGYVETIKLHSYPRPVKGWYNLNSSDSITVANGVRNSMLDTCPDGFQDHGRDVCIVPCDPPDACLGDNYCAYGYTSKEPLFRCAYCDKGFYKRAGECIKCPDSPAGLFIGFIILVVFMCGVAFQLNKRQVNIAVVSIGIDFFQVLAIFSQSRIKWPPVIKELFHVLSAFNLNIEIVAPECLIPDVSYKQKFWFIMILPLCISAIFAINYVVILAYKAVILGQEKKRWHSHSPALISSLLILVYMLYLYLTRTIFDVFNCTPTMPPDGYTYLQVVFERCGVPGGTQVTLLPYAVAGLIVYTGGYPLYIGYSIWKNKELVMEDQLLRAKGAGTDLLSGPRTYNLRLTYGRSYFQFKPDYCLWILAIIIRKFFIALTAVVFNKNASFQMAACLLVMFIAYAAQTHVRPYMSPGNFEQVLREHTEASFTSAIHARLRSALANIETRGRKKVRKNLLNFEGKVDRAAVFGILTSWLFEYNTVEEIMLFAAVIVCLMGIMYQANEVNTYYPQSKDSVTAVVLIVIIAAIIYFVTVLVTEIVVLYNEEHRTKRLTAEASRKRKVAGSESADDKQRRGQGRLVDDTGDINTGKLDTQMNPLFMSKGGDGVSATSSLGIDSIMAQRTPPPPELWVIFQQGYADLHTQLEAANSRLAESKRAAQLSSLNTEDTVVSGTGPAANKKKAFDPQATGGNNNSNNGDAFASFRKGNKAPVAMRSIRKNPTSSEQ